MTAFVEELRVEALIAAPGCPETVVDRMIVQSATDFYRETQAWRHITDPCAVARGRPAVELEVLEHTMVCRLYWVRLDGELLSAVSMRDITRDEGTPTAYAAHGLSNTVTLDRIPDKSYGRNGVVASVALAPVAGCTELPDELYAAHRDGILYGAVARLLAIPNVSWGNLNDARVFASMAQGVKDAAQREAQALQSPVARTVRYGGI